MPFLIYWRPQCSMRVPVQGVCQGEPEIYFKVELMTLVLPHLLACPHLCFLVARSFFDGWITSKTVSLLNLHHCFSMTNISYYAIWNFTDHCWYDPKHWGRLDSPGSFETCNTRPTASFYETAEDTNLEEELPSILRSHPSRATGQQVLSLSVIPIYQACTKCLNTRYVLVLLPLSHSSLLFLSLSSPIPPSLSLMPPPHTYPLVIPYLNSAQ